MAYASFPLDFNNKGAVVEVDYDAHIYQMMEQFLFTDYGERVNRPDFGAGIMQMVFSANSPEVATALQFHLQAALQQLFGSEIKLENLEATSYDSTLQIVITYTVLALKTRKKVRFTWSNLE